MVGDLLAYNELARSAWPLLAGHGDPDRVGAAPAGPSGHPGPPGAGGGPVGSGRRRSCSTAAFPEESWELATWPTCQRLLPHVLTATEHAERLGVADEQTGELLTRTSRYLRIGGPTAGQAAGRAGPGIFQEALGPDHPEVGDRCDELGRVLCGLGDYQAARQQLARALAIHERAYGPDHTKVASRHNELGVVLWNLGTRPAHEPNTSGLWRSVRPTSAPTTPTWPPGTATSAPCCRILGIWPELALEHRAGARDRPGHTWP